MAGSSLYKDEDDAGAITDINVTPFVDVVLVLLVVFIVTAKLIVARGVEIDKPKAATGGEVQSTLRVSVKRAERRRALRQRRPVHRRRRRGRADQGDRRDSLRSPRRSSPAIPRRRTASVMHAIDLVQQAGVTAIALENQRP